MIIPNEKYEFASLKTVMMKLFVFVVTKFEMIGKNFYGRWPDGSFCHHHHIGSHIKLYYTEAMKKKDNSTVSKVE
jgi:hypothetical protein